MQKMWQYEQHTASRKDLLGASVEIRLASNMGPVGSERLWHASQFDPAIDKERIISILR
jgi:hypothetical protein